MRYDERVGSLITCDAEIMSGTPVFKNTRVPIKNLIDYLEAGDNLDEFLEDFPAVTREQAVQALELARDALLTHAYAHALGGANYMNEELFVSQEWTLANGWTSGIEGPACDAEGNLYAVNYARQHTIGKVTPQGVESVFIELPNGSIGNGIRFNSEGFMFIADYTNHNVLKVDMQTREITVHAHEPKMNQPNDLGIGANDLLYASDPNWSESTGQLWRVDTDGSVTLLEADMGTTNGIEVSPDERTLYVNESVQRNVWAYDLSANGELSNKRLLIRFPDFNMDGMRCDIAGNLYITRHGKGTVAKLSPDGEVLLEVALTGKLCSNIAFGGPDGCTCYVTMADRGNIESFRADLPGRSWQLFQ